ncbi:MAG: DUF1641 domain-containing protein [Thermoplasmataceae archaeon]
MEDKEIENLSDIDLEPYLKQILGNKKLIRNALGTLQKITDPGTLSAMNRFLEEFSPGDIEALISIISSKELIILLKKTVGTLSGLSYALSRETTSDTLQSLLYNLEDVSESMVDGAKNPQPLSLFRLLSLLKDEEVASGMTAVIGALKAIGRTLKKVETE